MFRTAKEASRQIVHDVLTAAGVRQHGDENTEELEDDFEIDLDTTNYEEMGEYQYEDYDDDDEQGRNVEENSPSVVRKAAGFEDDTF